MSEMVKVVVDAMGGDNAPVEPVKAAVEAVKEKHNIQVILTGQEDVIKAELQKYQDYPKDRIRVVHASQVIETAEPPVMAIQKKKDSSIVVGLNLVKKQEADAFVSSGSTGAVLVGGQVIVGRIKGIQRPPLAPLIPTAKGVSLLIGTNLGGLGTLIASMASLISYKYIVRSCPEKKGIYFRWFTIANAGFLVILMAVYFLVFYSIR